MENTHNGKDYFKDKQEFFVNQPLTKVTGMKRNMSEMDVVQCCCFKSGKVKTVAYFEKDAYCPGETANLVTEIENHSSKNCKSVSGSLIQRLTVNSGWFSKELESVLKKVYTEGVPANSSKAGPDSQRNHVVLDEILFKSSDEREDVNVIGS